MDPSKLYYKLLNKHHAITNKFTIITASSGLPYVRPEELFPIDVDREAITEWIFTTKDVYIPQKINKKLFSSLHYYIFEYEQLHGGRSLPTIINDFITEYGTPKKRAMRSDRGRGIGRGRGRGRGGIRSAAVIGAADVGAAVEDIDTDESDEDEDECPICADGLDPSDVHAPLVLTECGHRFHRKCFTDWLAKGNNSCPYCRKENPKYAGRKKQYSKKRNCNSRRKLRYTCKK